MPVSRKTEIFFEPSVILTWFFILRIDLLMKIILNTHIMMFWCLEKFLESFEIQKHPQKQLVALTFIKFSESKSSFWEGMKSKKLPSAYVFCFRIRLRPHTTMPFASAPYYDPKQHLPCTTWDVLCSRKNFQSSRSHASGCEKHKIWLQILHFTMIYLEHMNET